MGRTPNVNVKGASERSYINVKVEESCGKVRFSGSPQARIRRAQRIADDLLRKFGPQGRRSYQYFCKCAYCMAESKIWDIYEQSCSIKVANKLAYFLAVTKAQPEMA